MTDKKQTIKRQFTGTVVSVAMKNTVVVRVDRPAVHPRYEKRYTASRKFASDCRMEGIRVGDRVVIEETRPISKTKRWRVIAKV
ncbi:MAG: 30S ribosomal protein S17 [Parcubacteria group bacterium]|nr:30S ribosomal protein S17 [Parcubacteria group bacterium]